MAKISVLIISMIVFGMVLIGSFGALISSLVIHYNPDDYNSSKLDRYDKISELASKTTEIENKTTGLQGSSAGVTDILGGFFESGYNAMVLSYSSVSIFSDMFYSAQEDIPFLDNINIFAVGIFAIVTIIVLFIILKIVVKGDL